MLTTLIGDAVTATLPEIEAQPDDPLGELSYPLVTVEVSYVSGVNGANLFVLTPEQSATLAAVMMGLDEPSGDGLSDLELSAVSEAMNQMMGAATNVLADTPQPRHRGRAADLRGDHRRREAPAPRSSTRRTAPASGSSPTGSTADVVQLVPTDFALHLQAAFAAADQGRAVTHRAASATAPSRSRA